MCAYYTIISQKGVKKQIVYDIRNELEIIRLLHMLPKEYILCEIGRLKAMVERLSTNL